MFKANFEFVEITPELRGVHYKSEKTGKTKTSLKSVPPKQIVAFYTQVGTLQGLFEAFALRFYNGKISLSIESGKYLLEGEATFYQKSEYEAANCLLEQIDGIACAISRGYLGEYSFTITYEQVCVVTPK